MTPESLKLPPIDLKRYGKGEIIKFINNSELQNPNLILK